MEFFQSEALALGQPDHKENCARNLLRPLQLAQTLKMHAFQVFLCRLTRTSAQTIPY